MAHWHDTMVDQPKTDGAVYVTGWTVSGLAVLGTIVAVWIFWNLGRRFFRWIANGPHGFCAPPGVVERV